jgi:hypothetical protein
MTDVEQNRRRPAGVWLFSLAMAVLAVVTASAITFAGGPAGSKNTAVFTADATAQPTAPPATPTKPSAAPTMKSSPFQGNWSGGGPFRGGGWPGS